MTKEEIVNKLTSLKGIGASKAEAIYNAGFHTIEKITAASIEELTKANGISESVAASIQEQLGSTAKPVSKEKPSEKKKEVPEKKEPKVEKKDTSNEEKKSVIPKKKPELSDSTKQSLQIRKDLKKRTPKFQREEWFRYKRLGKSWRRPDGITSKMRRNFKYRPNKVRVGYRGPEKVRGLHPSGFEEKIVHTVSDLESINPKTQAARIGSSVGTRKRLDIEKKAKELDIRLLNI
jgi:large subunit ribosomal protein L32e